MVYAVEKLYIGSLHSNRRKFDLSSLTGFVTVIGLSLLLKSKIYLWTNIEAFRVLFLYFVPLQNVSHVLIDFGNLHFKSVQVISNNILSMQLFYY